MSVFDFIAMVKVVDCRICGDPNSVLRFAFIEFTDEGELCLILLSVRVSESDSHCLCDFVEGARASLSLAGTMLGFYPVRVLPSKTAIAPVNPTFLPRVLNLTVPLC